MPDAEDAEKEALRLARSKQRAELPAIYIDTWSTTTWKDHVRIAFGEEMTIGDFYRSAMVMTLANAKLLAEHLLRVAAREEERAQKRKLSLGLEEAEEAPDA